MPTYFLIQHLQFDWEKHNFSKARTGYASNLLANIVICWSKIWMEFLFTADLNDWEPSQTSVKVSLSKLINVWGNPWQRTVVVSYILRSSSLYWHLDGLTAATKRMRRHFPAQNARLDRKKEAQTSDFPRSDSGVLVDPCVSLLKDKQRHLDPGTS